MVYTESKIEIQDCKRKEFEGRSIFRNHSDKTIWVRGAMNKVIGRMKLRGVLWRLKEMEVFLEEEFY